MTELFFFSFYVLPLFCILSSVWWPSLASQTCGTLMVRHKKWRSAVATSRGQTPFSPRGCIPSLISKLSIMVAWECVLSFSNYLKPWLFPTVSFFLPPIIPTLSTFLSPAGTLSSLFVHSALKHRITPRSQEGTCFSMYLRYWLPGDNCLEDTLPFKQRFKPLTQGVRTVSDVRCPNLIRCIRTLERREIPLTVMPHCYQRGIMGGKSNFLWQGSMAS